MFFIETLNNLTKAKVTKILIMKVNGEVKVGNT